MRQSQQKNRMRGRGRKGPSPLSRTFESNGPDVKIRGTASHVAEKYASLARDALAAGDTVMAENYLQHAEHYNRIVAAAAAAQSSRVEDGSAAFGRGPQPDIASFAGEDDEEGSGEQRGEGGRHESMPPARPAEQPAERGEYGAQGNGEPGGEQRPRPEHRSRRRPRPAEGGHRPNGNGEFPGHGAEAANGIGRPRSGRADISPDASMLPDSIVGRAPQPAPETGTDD